MRSANPNGLRRRDLLVAALAFWLGAVAPARSETPAPKPRSFSAEGLARVGDYIRNEIASGKIPGAILLIQQHGKPVYFESFGVRDLATKLAMTPDTIFRLYSMSKPVTSVAVMMLVEDGKVRLDDPVSKFIPAFADMKVGVEKPGADGNPALVLQPLARPVTILDLLRHTAGIPYGFYGSSLVRKLYADAGLFDADATNEELVDRLTKLPLAEQPGTLWTYGYATDVLGRVVEIVSGKTLYAFEKQRLFDPLGMSETAYFVADESKRPRIAEPMPTDRAISPTSQLRDPMVRRRIESGGAGLVGTIGDYARFTQIAERRHARRPPLSQAGDHRADGLGPSRAGDRSRLCLLSRRDQRLRPRLCRPHLGAAEHELAARRISLGRRRRHLFLHRSRRRHVRDLHGADAVAAWSHPAGIEDADLSGDGAVGLSPHDLAYVADHLLDHVGRDVEMRAGADAAVHHGQQDAARAQRRH